MEGVSAKEDMIMHDTVRLGEKNVRMIAHRGLSGLELENTAAAFVAAGNRSYWGIETDVHRTLDGQFVVIHDDDTRRVTLCDLPVEGAEYETLRQLSMKDRDGRVRRDLCIPSLEEYVRICRKYEKYSVLELKNRFEPEDIARIVELIRREGWLERTVFISFELENLLDLRKLLPEQKAQYLVSRIDDGLLCVLKENHLDLDIRYTALTEDFVREAHAAGVEINVWTADDPADGHRLAAMGTDYITSNILE